jgi:hypothetical protein
MSIRNQPNQLTPYFIDVVHGASLLKLNDGELFKNLRISLLEMAVVVQEVDLDWLKFI